MSAPENPSAEGLVADRFRKTAPVIALTAEVVDNLRNLLDAAQKHASINGLPWRRGANAGKPLLYGGEEGRGALIAHGTIGSWNEIDLAVAAVNALPALLAAHEALVGVMPILGSAESNASGNPEWDYVGPRVAKARAFLRAQEPITDCGPDGGCEECDVCRYLSFLEWAGAVGKPEGSTIERNDTIDAYLRVTYPDQFAAGK